MTKHRQNLRPKLKHQRSTKRSRAGKNGPEWTYPTTGYPWGPPRPVVRGAQPCSLPRTAVRPCAAGIPPFSSRLFVFLCIFALFCLYNSMYLDLFSSQSIPYHTPFHLLRVRVVLRGERGRGEECKDSESGLWIERLKREFWMSNSFPSLLFSHFTFML